MGVKKVGGSKVNMRNTGGAAKGGNAMKMWMEFDSLTPGIKMLPGQLESALRTTMAYYEPQLENYAKINAPWQDQTTNARNGLVATSGKQGGTHYIVLAHQVPYGIWLEVRWSGKYAIIMPTIEEFGPRVMNTLTKILEKF